MALIICPECCGKISSLATKCPNCGYPLTSQNTPISNKPEIQFQDLDIGKQIINRKSDAAFEGIIFPKVESSITDIPNGKVDIFLHTQGIRILMESKTNYDIHISQIIRIERKTTVQNVSQTKSVICRALIAGTIGTAIGYYIISLLGNDSTTIEWLVNKEVLAVTLDAYMMFRALLIILTSTLLGGIIGGLSGLGIKNTTKTTQYVFMKFWEDKYNQPRTIVIECDEHQPISAFIARLRKEHSKNKEIKDNQI